VFYLLIGRPAIGQAQKQWENIRQTGKSKGIFYLLSSLKKKGGVVR